MFKASDLLSFLLKMYSYCFRMLISDSTGRLTLACFSTESHSMVTECSKVVLEQGQSDPYSLPPVLIALEEATYLFQLHFSTESTKENPLFVLDTVMDTGPHLLAIPLNTAPATITETEEEILLLAGPDASTEQTNVSRTTIEQPPDTPSPSATLTSQERPILSIVTDVLKSELKPEQDQQPQSPATTEGLLFTPPPAEVLQGSNPDTAHSTTNLQKRETRSQGAKPSVRRQLLKNDLPEEMGTPSKKTKQGD